MKRIIFVDDEPSIQEIITLAFAGEYEVLIFSSGEGLMENDFDIPDLFLIDKQLPGVDGIDICRFLKKQDRTKHIPVIILSASLNIRKLAEAAGADEVIEKPFALTDLRKIIAAYAR